MGQVYRARDLRLNRSVAIKVLASSHRSEREALIRLRREAVTASSLNHPALITIFDVGESADGQVFVAMELVDGVSLREALRESRPLTQLLELLSQVADGLSAAHDACVIHRDVKPENIMIARNGYAKVVDFGLAKSTLTPQSAEDTPTLFVTETGRVMGTVVYMSPEQLRGEPLEGASDVFSLGSVLHEALSGHAPFHAKTAAETIGRILHDPPPSLPPDTHPGLVALVARMLDKDPRARVSMHTVARELREVARGSGETTSIAAARSRGRWRLLVASSLVIAFLAAAGFVWSRNRDARGASPEHPAEPQVAELYAQARFFADDPKWPVQDKSIPILEEVVKRDPKFVPARIELAHQYARRAFQHDPDRSWEQKAFLEADRILRLDPDSPAAHTVVAQLKWTKARGFPHEDALIEVSKALATEPAFAEARHIRAGILMHVGLLEEALADYDNLRAQFPTDEAILMRIARIHLWQGDAATALREFREYTPDNSQIGTALIILGRHEEALAFARQQLATKSARIDRGDLEAVYALALAKTGQSDAAERAIAHATAQGQDSSHFHHALYSIACARAAMGDAARAVDALEAVSREGMPCHPLFEKDPLLDPIRGDARFQRFLADSRDAFAARRRAMTRLIAAPAK